MKGGLNYFDISPRPATEGQPIKITFDYGIDKATLTLSIYDQYEKVIRRVKVQVSGSKGELTFTVPKGWGPALFIDHKDFIVGMVTVKK